MSDFLFPRDSLRAASMTLRPARVATRLHRAMATLAWPSTMTAAHVGQVLGYAFGSGDDPAASVLAFSSMRLLGVDLETARGTTELAPDQAFVDPLCARWVTPTADAALVAPVATASHHAWFAPGWPAFSGFVVYEFDGMPTAAKVQATSLDGEVTMTAVYGQDFSASWPFSAAFAPVRALFELGSFLLSERMRGPVPIPDDFILMPTVGGLQ